MSEPIKICIVNRNYPPTFGATGYHAHQLVKFLLNQTDFSIHVVTCGNLPDSRKERIRISYCAQQYNGTNSKLRLLGATRSAYELIKKAKKTDAHFFIIMTDPPILNYWASILLKNNSWATWTMDLYPDAFVASGLINNDHWIYRHYKNKLIQNPPSLLITLGKGQSKYLTDQFYPNTPEIIWPVGLREIEEIPLNNFPSWYNPDKITFAYLGNLGEAHDPEWLIQLGVSMDPNLHQLIIACGGKNKSLIQQTFESSSHVHIEEFIPAGQLRYIDIHLVVLRQNWTHICVPSKAISAIQHGGAVLFCGQTQSDTWQYVKNCGWQLSQKSELKAWLFNLDKESIRKKKNTLSGLLNNLVEQRNQGWQKLVEYIQEST